MNKAPERKKRRPKPFVSKQNRGETGRKKKPGRPSSPKKMKTPEMFYFRGYTFRTKKELKDRIKALLLKLVDHTVSGPITRERSVEIFQLLNELLMRHPNYANWGNKTITAFSVTRADTKKRPPILWAAFKGNEKVLRNVAWLRCVHKSVPTIQDQLYSAMAYAVRDQLVVPNISTNNTEIISIISVNNEPNIQLPLAPRLQQLHGKKRKRAADKVPLLSLPPLLDCSRCGANKRYIDHVRPSYTTALFHEIVNDFMAQYHSAAKNTTTPLEIPNVLYWEQPDFSFRILSKDAMFRNAWQEYHKKMANIGLLCETCRIKDWVAAFCTLEDAVVNTVSNAEPITEAEENLSVAIQEEI